LRERYADPGGEPAAWSPDQRLAHLVHLPPVAPDDVVAQHPAHLHVDLLPRLQGHGLGRRVMTAMLTLLAADGATGVHLGVGPGNRRAIGFYDRLGFAELQRKPHVVFMGRPLP
jgi:ribosomal protein S18 acetylase RimI-like enzyme